MGNLLQKQKKTDHESTVGNSASHEEASSKAVVKTDSNENNLEAARMETGVDGDDRNDQQDLGKNATTPLKDALNGETNTPILHIDADHETSKQAIEPDDNLDKISEEHSNEIVEDVFKNLNELAVIKKLQEKLLDGIVCDGLDKAIDGVNEQSLQVSDDKIAPSVSANSWYNIGTNEQQKDELIKIKAQTIVDDVALNQQKGDVPLAEEETEQSFTSLEGKCVDNKVSPNKLISELFDNIEIEAKESDDLKLGAFSIVNNKDTELEEHNPQNSSIIEESKSDNDRSVPINELIVNEIQENIQEEISTAVTERAVEELLADEKLKELIQELKPSVAPQHSIVNDVVVKSEVENNKYDVEEHPIIKNYQEIDEEPLSVESVECTVPQQIRNDIEQVQTVTENLTLEQTIAKIADEIGLVVSEERQIIETIESHYEVQDNGMNAVNETKTYEFNSESTHQTIPEDVSNETLNVNHAVPQQQTNSSTEEKSGKIEIQIPESDLVASVSETVCDTETVQVKATEQKPTETIQSVVPYEQIVKGLELIVENTEDTASENLEEISEIQTENSVTESQFSNTFDVATLDEPTTGTILTQEPHVVATQLDEEKQKVKTVEEELKLETPNETSTEKTSEIVSATIANTTDLITALISEITKDETKHENILQQNETPQLVIPEQSATVVAKEIVQQITTIIEESTETDQIQSNAETDKHETQRTESPKKFSFNGFLTEIAQELILHRFEYENTTNEPIETCKIIGSFTGWNETFNLINNEADSKKWFKDLHLAPGEYQYKFYINNEPRCDPTKPIKDDNNYVLIIKN